MRWSRRHSVRSAGILLALAPVVGALPAAALAGPGQSSVSAPTASPSPSGTPSPTDDADSSGPTTPAASPSSSPLPEPIPPNQLTERCDRQFASTVLSRTPWQQKRLQLERVREFATGRGVTVAVVDTGVDFGNPQLGGASIAPPASFVPADQDLVPPWRDCNGHGTFVAGIIAGRENVADQTTPFVGVAPHARILSVRVAKERDAGSADELAAGIRYAADHGADVINVSMVTSSPRGTLRDAVADALAKGVVVVVASGNTGGQQGNAETWPAGFAGQKGFEGLIVVGATNEAGKVADFTTTSVPISVVAPGEAVVSTAPISGHGGPDQGTSFAAPFVSGVAALVLEAYDKKLTPVQVKQRIEFTADHPGFDLPDQKYGWGVVNPFEAVTAILPARSGGQETAEEKPAIKPIIPPTPPDTTARNVALSVGGGAVALVLLVLGGIAVFRRGRKRGWRPSYPPSDPATR